jgi:Protein of unknown function (DUF2510)
MSGAPPSTSGILVTTGFRPLAFILYACTPRLVLDGGEPVRRPWGESFIPAAPGRHAVRCWFRYSWFAHAGDATTTVDVAPGQVVSIGYRAPFFMFSPGKWAQKGGQPAGGASATAPVASWYPDPTARHQQRYWDGATWTDNVSDNGVTARDRL